MNTSDKKKARELLEQIRYLRKELGSKYPLQFVQILLEAALDQGCSHKDMYEKLLPQSSASTGRGIKDLAQISWKKSKDGTRRKAGFGFLETRPDDMEMRIKRIYLSKEGDKFIHKLVNRK